MNLAAVPTTEPRDYHDDSFAIALPGTTFSTANNFKIWIATYWNRDTILFIFDIANVSVILGINQSVFYGTYHQLLIPAALLVFFAAAARAGVITANLVTV